MYKNRESLALFEKLNPFALKTIGHTGSFFHRLPYIIHPLDDSNMGKYQHNP